MYVARQPIYSNNPFCLLARCGADHSTLIIIFLTFFWKKDELNHKGNMLYVLIMACHAMLKAWPLGFSHDKIIGLRTRFLST